MTQSDTLKRRGNTKNGEITFMLKLLALSLAFFATSVSANSNDASSGDVNPYKITVLSTNISDYGGLGEWSFAALFEGEQESVLFDTGFRSDTVLHNVLHLGIDLAPVSKVVLSHFHGDHTGGLLVLREHFKKANPSALSEVYVAKGFFDQRQTADGRLVGPGDFKSAAEFKKAAEHIGISFTIVESPVEIAPALWLTGPVPRKIEAYNGPDGLFVATESGLAKDIIKDDQSLGYLTNKGWLMTSGCGHSGLMNTGEALQNIKPEPVYSILGGFHLWKADKTILDETALWLKSAGLDLMVGGHCTGIGAAETIAAQLEIPRSRISHAAVGSIISPDLRIIRSSVE